MPTVKQISADLWEVPLGAVNAFLVHHPDDGLVLIDTGFPGSAPKIMEAVKSIGRGEIRHILVTHCHGDHAGSLAEMKRQFPGAKATMHPDDAEIVQAGGPNRPLKPGPGLRNALLGRLLLLIARPKPIQAAAIDHFARDGDMVPGGLQAIHVPGHCKGQLAFFRPEDGGALIAADSAANVLGLAMSPLYEDEAEGKRSLKKLAKLTFEVACFGHGKSIRSQASEQFRRKWA